MSKTLSPPQRPDKLRRISVPLSEEAIAVFTRMGKAQGRGAGAAVSEWVQEQIEAAEFVTQQLEKAREAPKQVMRDMHSYALALVDEMATIMHKASDKERKPGGRKGAPPAGMVSGRRASALGIPPSCNTGGKVPTSRGGKSA